MRRAIGTLAAAAAAAVLAGCPIPQAVPDYPPGTITPPRILVDQMDGNGTTVHFVPANCPTTEPLFPLSARVVDTNTIENIEARWFVNYDPAFEMYNQPVNPPTVVPPDADPTVLTRQIPDYVFRPYQYPPARGTGSASGPPFPGAGLLRVVELVVSNGFDPAATTTAYPLPNRTPRLGFETQVYRWVFMSMTADPGCTPGDPGCCP